MNNVSTQQGLQPKPSPAVSAPQIGNKMGGGLGGFGSMGGFGGAYGAPFNVSGFGGFGGMGGFNPMMGGLGGYGGFNPMMGGFGGMGGGIAALLGQLRAVQGGNRDPNAPPPGMKLNPDFDVGRSMLTDVRPDDRTRQMFIPDEGANQPPPGYELNPDYREPPPGTVTSDMGLSKYRPTDAFKKSYEAYEADRRAQMNSGIGLNERLLSASGGSEPAPQQGGAYGDLFNRLRDIFNNPQSADILARQQAALQNPTGQANRSLVGYNFLTRRYEE